MMQIHSLPENISFSEIMETEKIDFSLGTEATSTDFLKKKISLCSCSSSVSLEEMLEISDEKEIFAKYLAAIGTHKQGNIFNEMKRMYDSYRRQEENPQDQFVSLSEGPLDNRGSILAFFINIWLKHMGYGTQKNKNYLISRAKLYIGSNKLHSFTKVYQNLNLLPLGKAEKTSFLLETCRNGWEYFIQQIGRRKLITEIDRSGRKGQKGQRSRIFL